MSIERLMTQDVVILPYNETGVDDYNDPAPVLGSPVSVKGYIEQQNTQEDRDDRELGVSSWLLFLPAGTALGHRDVVLYAGNAFEIDGTVNEVWNPRTASVHHLEAVLRLLES